MKVFLVCEIDWDDHAVRGVFTRMAKALAYVATYTDEYRKKYLIIEEHEVDSHDYKPIHHEDLESLITIDGTHPLLAAPSK